MKQKISYEQAVERLEELLEQLDSGELPLDDSLKLFGEGVELVRYCREKLAEASLTVEKLLPE